MWYQVVLCLFLLSATQSWSQNKFIYYDTTDYPIQVSVPDSALWTFGSMSLGDSLSVWYHSNACWHRYDYLLLVVRGEKAWRLSTCDSKNLDSLRCASWDLPVQKGQRILDSAFSRLSAPIEWPCVGGTVGSETLRMEMKGQLLLANKGKFLISPNEHGVKYEHWGGPMVSMDLECIRSFGYETFLTELGVSERWVRHHWQEEIIWKR